MYATAIDCVICDRCGKLHKDCDDTFFTIIGNINIGMEGGVVGNNLDKVQVIDGTIVDYVVRHMHYCRDECMKIVLCMSDG